MRLTTEGQAAASDLERVTAVFGWPMRSWLGLLAASSLLPVEVFGVDGLGLMSE